MYRKFTSFIVVAILFATLSSACIDIAFETNIEESTNVTTSEEETPTGETGTPDPSAPETSVSNPVIISSATAVVDKAIVRFTDEFAGISYGWNRSGNARLADDSIELRDSYPGSTSGIASETGLEAGMAAVFLLKFAQGEFDVYLVGKPAGGDTYVGITTSGGYGLRTTAAKNDLYAGGERLNGNLLFLADQWYFVMIRILEGGAFYIKIWEKENPDSFRETGVRLGNEFEGILWYPSVTVTAGKVWVDAYQELEFK